MASRGLTINFSRLSVLASGSGVPTTTYPATANGTTIFEGIEMDGRDLSLAGIEVGIDNNQKIFVTKDVELTMMVGGTDVLSGTNINEPADASPAKSVVALYSGVGELGIYIPETYVYAMEDFGGEQLRCMVTCRIRAGAPIVTFTVA